jgi:hypothetical protein
MAYIRPKLISVDGESWQALGCLILSVREPGKVASPIFQRNSLKRETCGTWFAFPESWGRVAAGSFNLHSLVVLLGGGFIIYTAMKEIFHSFTIQIIGCGKIIIVFKLLLNFTF